MSPAERSSRVDAVLRDSRRLEVVHNSQMLDTPIEDAFDSLNRLAAILVSAPASFLSIVSEDHDFYKSQHGFPASLATSRHLKGRTFCHLAIASSEPLVINDTHADPVWRPSLQLRVWV